MAMSGGGQRMIFADQALKEHPLGQIVRHAEVEVR